MIINGLIGKKIGMTTFFHKDGKSEAVTAIELGPCIVTQVKTLKRDGYDAVQVGFEESKNLNKPDLGHQSRSGGKFRFLQEFSVDNLDEFEVGQKIDMGIFEIGEPVKVIGDSKGRGFSGVVRRYNFRGGPKTHGQSDRHRAPGSIGAGSSPGRVWPGTRMSGRYGGERFTIRGINILAKDSTNWLIWGFTEGADAPAFADN